MKRSKKSVGGGSKFVFKPGRRVSGISAQVAGEELRRIYTRDGSLRPPTVVEEALPPAAPLHPAFEWREKVAAHEYRLWQARHLIGSVIEVETRKDESTGQMIEVQVDEYHHVPTQQSYKTTDDVIAAPDDYASAITALMIKRDSLEVSIMKLRRAAEHSPGYEEKLQALEIAIKTVQALKLALQRAA